MSIYGVESFNKGARRAITLSQSLYPVRYNSTAYDINLEKQKITAKSTSFPFWSAITKVIL